MTPSPAQQAATFLNGLLAADPACVRELFKAKAVCNEAVLDHPTVQTSAVMGFPCVGMLGVLNGLLLQMNRDEVLCAHFDEDTNTLLEFRAGLYRKVL